MGNGGSIAPSSPISQHYCIYSCRHVFVQAKLAPDNFSVIFSGTRWNGYEVPGAGMWLQPELPVPDVDPLDTNGAKRVVQDTPFRRLDTGPCWRMGRRLPIQAPGQTIDTVFDLASTCTSTCMHTSLKQQSVVLVRRVWCILVFQSRIIGRVSGSIRHGSGCSLFVVPKTNTVISRYGRRLIETQPDPEAPQNRRKTRLRRFC